MGRPCLASLILSLFVAGCGEAPPLCVPGETQECVGPGACRGGQMCNAEGSGFEACACAEPDGGPEPDPDAGRDASVGEEDAGGDRDAGRDLDGAVPADGAVPDGGLDAGGPDAGIPDAGPCTVGCAPVELAAGLLHTCARRDNGEVLCWGRNQELQLGDGLSRHQDCAAPGADPEDCSGTPVHVRVDGAPLVSLTGASSLALDGFGQSCAIVASEVWCWSTEATPSVAGGVVQHRPLAERETHYPATVHRVAVEGGRQCAISGAQRELTCRGNNSRGQLGTGAFRELELTPGPVVEAGPVALVNVLESEGGPGFHCARTAGAVYCWGANDHLQLGDGTQPHDECRDNSNTAFDCSPHAIAVGGAAPLGEVADLDVGRAHACVVYAPRGSPGAVLCWGDNRSGQSGQATTTEALGVPATVPGGVLATTIALGSHHSCALHSDGTVRCWGENGRGQLGDGLSSHGTTCVRDGQAADCSPAPVAVMGIADAQLIAAGGDHTCVVRSDATVWCWGANSRRQLGDGTRNDRFAPVRASFPAM